MPSLSTIGRQTLARYHRDWTRRAQAIVRQAQSKDVHQMRVAGRRLRAVLKAFKAYLPEKPAADPRLKQTGQALGHARDLDVHLVYLATVLPRWPAAARDALQPYRRYLQQRQTRLRREVQQAIKNSGFLQAQKSLQHLSNKDWPDATAPAAKGAKLLKKQLRKLRRASEQLSEDPSDAEFHRLRQTIRRLRYISEVFRQVGGRPLKHLVDQLIRWQDILGDAQDRATGTELVEAYLDAQKKEVPLAEERALIRLVKQMDQEKERLQEGLLMHWKRSQIRKMKKFLKQAFQAN